MRHHNQNRKFGRVRRQRGALLSGLARALILHGTITTTEAKAKELRPFIERLITKSKNDSVTARRLVTARLNDVSATRKLFTDTASKYSTRGGGYTRITKLEPRKGDAAKMAVIEFV